MSAKLKIQTGSEIHVEINDIYLAMPHISDEDRRKLETLEGERLVGVESLKTWLTERLEISQKYTTALDPQARRQARIEVDVYSRILSELEAQEAKPQ